MKQNPRGGQAMLLATLALGGAILGATAIAGLLMLYQLQSTNDSENSAKAIFAADSGVEWALFDFYCSSALPTSTPRCTVPPDYPSSTFTNVVTPGDVAVNVACYDGTDVQVPCYSTSTVSAISRGTSLTSRRTFYLTFSTSTVP